MLTAIVMLVVLAALTDYGIYWLRWLDWKTSPKPRQIPPDDIIGRVPVG